MSRDGSHLLGRLKASEAVSVMMQDVRFPDAPFRFDPKDFDRLLIWARDINASDIQIKTDDAPLVKLHGQWVRVAPQRLTASEVADYANTIGGKTATSVAKSKGPVDIAYQLRVDRTRVYHYRGNVTGLAGSLDQIGIFLRTFPDLPPPLEDLGLPEDLIASAYPTQGLVLVSGRTGSGKTTLLASLMGHALTTPPGRHVVTYEQPPEFDLRAIPGLVGTVSPSAVPEDAPTFAIGVQNALRQAPDIILVGEARDRDTISGVNTAAQTGHAVYSTTHTNNVHGTLPRMVDVFPEEERSTIMLNLVDNIRLIVHQRLVMGVDGERLALREYLAFDDDMRSELLVTDRLTVPVKIRQWVLDREQSLMDDARRLRHRIAPREYEALEAEFLLEARRWGKTA